MPRSDSMITKASIGLLIREDRGLFYVWSPDYKEELKARPFLFHDIHSPIGTWISFKVVHNNENDGTYAIVSGVERILEAFPTKVVDGKVQIWVECTSLRLEEPKIFETEKFGHVIDNDNILWDTNIGIRQKLWIERDYGNKYRWKISCQREGPAEKTNDHIWMTERNGKKVYDELEGLIVGVHEQNCWIWNIKLDREIFIAFEIVRHITNPVGKWIVIQNVYWKQNKWTSMGPVELLGRDILPTLIVGQHPAVEVTCFAIAGNEADGSVVFKTREFNDVCDVHGYYPNPQDEFKIWALKYQKHGHKSSWKALNKKEVIIEQHNVYTAVILNETIDLCWLFCLELCREFMCKKQLIRPFLSNGINMVGQWLRFSESVEEMKGPRIVKVVGVEEIRCPFRIKKDQLEILIEINGIEDKMIDNRKVFRSDLFGYIVDHQHILKNVTVNRPFSCWVKRHKTPIIKSHWKISEFNNLDEIYPKNCATHTINHSAINNGNSNGCSKSPSVTSEQSNSFAFSTSRNLKEKSLKEICRLMLTNSKLSNFIRDQDSELYDAFFKATYC